MADQKAPESRLSDHRASGHAVPDPTEVAEGWVRLVTASGVSQAVRRDAIREMLGPYEFTPGDWIVQIAYGDRQHESVRFEDRAAADAFVTGILHD